MRKLDEMRPPAPGGDALGPGEHDLVGPYRLIEPIGEGAMGQVYRAEHTLLGRVVAIKMLRSELTCDDACVRRFLAEARAVNLIKHPHIIDVTDFACTPSGQPWFVMEMLEGSDLSLAASREPLSLKRTLEIVRQLCEALTSVHAAGVVHRDVKPENIFLQKRDGEDFITLLDFGIARLPDPTNADPRQEGLMGTSYYMAPEQAAAGPIDHRADLYAVGSTLFELVVGIGNTPFREELLPKQLMDVMTTPAPRLSDRATTPASVRGDLDRLVARLLAKQPEDRPSSAREVAAELARIAEKLAANGSAPLALKKVDALPPVHKTRTRPRRRVRERGVRTSYTAIMLAAVVAAAAMWIATREGNWTRPFRGARPGQVETTIPAASTEHIVRPLDPAEDARSSAPIAPPLGSAQEAAGERAVDAARAPNSARASKPKRASASDKVRAGQGDARPAKRAAPSQRTDDRVADDKEVRAPEQPALTITPAPVAPSPDAPAPVAPAPEPPVPDDEVSFDRDLVLDPFSH